MFKLVISSIFTLNLPLALYLIINFKPIIISFLYTKIEPFTKTIKRLYYYSVAVF